MEACLETVGRFWEWLTIQLAPEKWTIHTRTEPRMVTGTDDQLDSTELSSVLASKILGDAGPSSTRVTRQPEASSRVRLSQMQPEEEEDAADQDSQCVSEKKRLLKIAA